MCREVTDCPMVSHGPLVTGVINSFCKVGRKLEKMLPAEMPRLCQVLCQWGFRLSSGMELSLAL